MEKPLQASVIIPTYNRADCLKICLDALAELKTEPALFEIIIVDNNSTDGTSRVSAEFIQTHPEINVKYLLETRQGASNARNRGILNAQGPIICFLDDDAPPSREWLNSIAEGFDDPAIGCVGGPAILDFQGQEVPPWLHGDLQGLLSGYGLPYSEPTLLSSWAQFPFSCNMAVRKQALDEVGNFRVDLGRSGGGLLAGEETELIHRMHLAGWKVIYLPNAIVRHIVSPEKLAKSYIYRVGFGLAATHVHLTSDRRLHMILRWFLSDLWYATRMFFKLTLAVVRRSPLWFDDYMVFWMVFQRIPIRSKAIFNRPPAFQLSPPRYS
jgi:glycosyltransferase involved in cell wall biosynthesis